MGVSVGERSREQPSIEPKEGGSAAVSKDKGDSLKGAKLVIHNFPEEGGVVWFVGKVKGVVLEEPVNPRQVGLLKKFESKFHEEAVVLEKQIFDA